MSTKSFNHSEILLDPKWQILENMVKEMRINNPDLPVHFKINRAELKTHLQNYSQSNKILIDFLDFEHSLLILGEKIIMLDYNPAPGDYKARYLGFGTFGKVKKGVDSQNNHYAVKTERKRENVHASVEQAIMKKLGLLIGTLSRQTNSKKLWLDGKPIHEKETSVMPLLKGEELRTFFDSKHANYRRFTELQIHVIGLAVISSIENLHKQGIAHRDINLNNFLLNMKHLPENLTLQNFENYLAGNDENHDFNKLIHVIDFGLACEIPQDGTEVQLPLNSFFSERSTAPESYAFNHYSSDLEAYSVAYFLEHSLGLHLNQFEFMFSSQLECIKSHYEKQLRDVNALKHTVAKGKNLAENQKLDEQLTLEINNLKHLQFILKMEITNHPPIRFSLEEIYDSLKENTRDKLESSVQIKAQPLILAGYLNSYPFDQIMKKDTYLNNEGFQQCVSKCST